VSTIIARSRTRLIAALAAVAVLVGVLLLAVASQARSDSVGDQCSKPISERVGGWTCPGRN
jgi:hypothetical protein